MKIFLVARDAAPSLILERVQAELQLRGHEVCALLGHGKPLDNFSKESMVALALTSDLVLSGMSAAESLTKEEVLAADIARENGIPYGFVCDIYGCHKRPWFAHLRDGASFVFTIPGDEADAQIVFSHAKVVASGNPCWEEYFRPSAPKEETRSRLSLSAQDKVIFCSGAKDLALNALFMGGVIAAAHLLKRVTGQWSVVISRHPGDRNSAQLYDELQEFSVVPVKIVNGSGFENHDLIAASDVLVAQASNTGIEAVCMRKPVIHYFTELYLNKMESLGGRVWPPCQLGIAAQVLGDPSALAVKILDLLIYGEYEREMLPKQQEIFPDVADSGAAVRKICDALESGVVRK
ncbi:MAG: hypothetical protein Q8L24_01685 [bacterium]|nr:hypothetical protein [bacterium]